MKHKFNFLKSVKFVSGFGWTKVLAGSKVNGMKPNGWQLEIIILVAVVFSNAMPTAHGQQFPLLTLSNTIPTNISAPQKIELETNQILPSVEMRDVPISQGIEHLARAGGINYMVDTRLAKWWSTPVANGNGTHEPALNISWKNLTAKQALVRLLGERHLVLAEDSVTSIARITYTNQALNSGDAGLMGNDTNLIPLIQFYDVPITTALDNFARLANLDYALDPKIGYGMPDKHGQIVAEPLLTLRWTAVTATQAFVALCENYDLVIFKDPASGVLLIRPNDHPITKFVEGRLLGSDTNGAVLIAMQDVRLDDALKQLAKKADIKVAIDITALGEDFSTLPVISIRWNDLTPRQAIIALCEIYDLVIVKDAATGVVSIKPED
jgi:hypothetical protein